MAALSTGSSQSSGDPAGVDVAVVIVTYNSAHVVEALLDSLADAVDGLAAEIVVVDNGSTDRTLEILASRDDCRAICSTNRGYSAGINLGVRAASPATAILMLNPDVRMGRGSARRMFEALCDGRAVQVGIIAPQIRDDSGALDYSLRRRPSLLRNIGFGSSSLGAFSEIIGGEENYLRPRTADWAVGAILMISKECFEALEGFDESFFLYSEETDFCMRAQDKGFITRYEPSAVTEHIGGQSGQDNKTHVMMVLNRVRFYRRRHGLFASSAFLAVTVLREVFWLRRESSRSRAALTALFRPSRRPTELGCSDSFIPR